MKGDYMVSNKILKQKEATVNAFRTVEGRFKEVRFNRSMDQSYQIISLAINKKEGFDQFVGGYRILHDKFYHEINNHPNKRSKK